MGPHLRPGAALRFALILLFVGSGLALGTAVVAAWLGRSPLPPGLLVTGWLLSGTWLGVGILCAAFDPARGRGRPMEGT